MLPYAWRSGQLALLLAASIIITHASVGVANALGAGMGHASNNKPASTHNSNGLSKAEPHQKGKHEIIHHNNNNSSAE